MSDTEKEPKPKQTRSKPKAPHSESKPARNPKDGFRTSPKLHYMLPTPESFIFDEEFDEEFDEDGIEIEPSDSVSDTPEGSDET